MKKRWLLPHYEILRPSFFYEKSSVPVSCCKNGTKNCDTSRPSKTVFQAGCLEKLKENLRVEIVPIVMICLSINSVLAISILAQLVILFSLKMKDNHLQKYRSIESSLNIDRNWIHRETAV